MRCIISITLNLFYGGLNSFMFIYIQLPLFTGQVTIPMCSESDLHQTLTRLTVCVHVCTLCVCVCLCECVSASASACACVVQCGLTVKALDCRLQDRRFKSYLLPLEKTSFNILLHFRAALVEDLCQVQVSRDSSVRLLPKVYKVFGSSL